jgi:hypothetical protein
MQTDFDGFLQDLAHGQHHPQEHDWSEGGTVHTNDETGGHEKRPGRQARRTEDEVRLAV